MGSQYVQQSVCTLTKRKNSMNVACISWFWYHLAARNKIKIKLVRRMAVKVNLYIGLTEFPAQF